MTEPKQIDKFRAIAKELECDESEAAFNAKIKRVAKPEDFEPKKSAD